MARRKTREEIKTQDKWNIEKMYPDNASAEKDLKESVSDAEKYGKYKGHLADSA